MAGVFGDWSNGPIQFNRNSGAIEGRGTMDTPPSNVAGPTAPTPSPSPSGGGVLPFAGPNPEWGGGLTNGGGRGTGGDTFAPSNVGGSYGLSGGGISDGGGDTQFFDGGGVVDVDGDNDGDTSDEEADGATGAPQGAQSSTFDPMQAIQKVAGYGRQKMGLPQNFTQGPQGDQQQGFDDGGEVDDQGDGGVIPTNVTAGGNSPGSGGGGMPDPRAALSYLTGAGGVSADVATALEKHVDPQGTMEPSRRTVASILAAPNPEAAFGIMQHYRTKYNAYAGGAKAAMDQGNAGQAAVNATQAMSNVPTGYHVQFAPARGGIAMMASKLGPKGAQVQSAATGGAITDDLPESDNIEDRRDNDRTVTTPQKLAAQQKLSQPVGYSGVRGDLDDNGVIPKQVKAFDDGGEVDDEQGVIQQPPAEPEVPPQMAAGDDQQVSGDPQQGDDASGQPTILTPEQFKKMMSDGYDKPIDDGFAPWLKSILSAVNPIGSAEAAEGSGFRPGSIMDRIDSAKRGQPTTNGGPDPAVQAGLQDIGKQPQQPPNQPWQPTPSLMAQQQTPRPDASTQSNLQQDPNAANSTTAPKSVPKGDRVRPQPAQPQETRDSRLQVYQDKLEAIANKLYPSVGQQDQRNAYVGGMMQKAVESEMAMDKSHGQGKDDLEKLRQSGRQELERQKALAALDKQTAGDDRKDWRNTNTNLTKERMNELRILDSRLSQQQREQVRLLGQQLAANPNINQAEAMQRVQDISGKIGLDPKTTMDMITAHGQQGGGQQAPAPQPGQGQPQAPSKGGSMPSVGQQAPYTVNGQTRQYRFGADGQWHKM